VIGPGLTGTRGWGMRRDMRSDDRTETSFTRMMAATRDDYAVIARHSLGFQQGLPDRILRHLTLLAGDTGGYAVDRLTHSLQTATRAHRDRRDEEYVVCALVHDIGDTLASHNHSELAAVIVHASAQYPKERISRRVDCRTEASSSMIATSGGSAGDGRPRVSPVRPDLFMGRA